MNTVIFSIYDSGYRSSALLLSNGIPSIDDDGYRKNLKYNGSQSL